LDLEKYTHSDTAPITTATHTIEESWKIVAKTVFLAIHCKGFKKKYAALALHVPATHLQQFIHKTLIFFPSALYLSM
jgi:hypothetical protein